MFGWVRLFQEKRNNRKKDQDEEETKIMFVIAGLGNPTRQYEKTRHNVGFDAVDALAEK